MKLQKLLDRIEHHSYDRGILRSIGRSIGVLLFRGTTKEEELDSLRSMLWAQGSRSGNDSYQTGYCVALTDVLSSWSVELRDREETLFLHRMADERGWRPILQELVSSGATLAELAERCSMETDSLIAVLNDLRVARLVEKYRLGPPEIGSYFLTPLGQDILSAPSTDGR